MSRRSHGPRSFRKSWSGRSSRGWVEPLEIRRLLAGEVFTTILHDVNGNGVKDPEEPALTGWTVFVDYDRDAVLDADEPSAVTDIDGECFITGVPRGTWDVRQVLEPGWAPSVGFASFERVQVRDNETTDVLFLNVPAANGGIEGVVWNDVNGDGVRQASDPGLSGWTVFVDLDNNGDPDPGEPTDVTDADGVFAFPDLPTGDYRVREILPLNWDPTIGYDANAQVFVSPASIAYVDFGNFNTGTLGAIRGTVWNDLNADGVRAPSDVGLSGWTVFIDANANSTLDVGEQSAVTDALGNYSFPSVIEGTYRVMEELQAGWNVSPGYSVARNVVVIGDNTAVADFANYTPTLGSISGRVWNDQNGDGNMGVEPGLAGWTVYVDQNADGAFNAGEPSATSDGGGNYTITSVPIGGNLVREVLLVGWTPTAPGTGQQIVDVPNGTNVPGVNFGNQQRTDSEIRGTVFVDTDRDHIRDPGERGLAGITIFLDQNDNGILDAGEASTVTAADLFYTPTINEAGTYSFTHLPAGPYHVREIVPAVLSATLTGDRHQFVTLLGGEIRTGVDFANRFRGNEIRGVKYNDLDGDHVRDPGEPGIPDVTIYLDLDRDAVLDAGEPRTLTAADGSYAFVTNLTPGAYVVREIVPWGYTQTYPTTVGGTLWPTGVSNPAIGNVSPTSITASLAQGQTYNQTVSLTLPSGGAITNRADVFLLFDDTGSFTGNSPIVRAAFPQIISALQAALPGVDLGFGVGRFEEYANFAAEYGTGRPFVLNHPIVSASTTNFMLAIQSALDRTAPGYGGDLPETDFEALFQAVTGRGFDGNNNGTYTDSGAAGLVATQTTPGTSGDVPAFSSYTLDPSGNLLPAAGNIGGAGFRAGSLPIILLATDTGFAYQPRGETTITGVGGVTLPVSRLTQASRPTTPFASGAGIQETITALNALGALVIGLGTNAAATADPRQGLEAIATLTGAINQSLSTIANGTLDPIAPGDPMYFQIASGFGTSVANGIVAAIQNAVSNVAVNITLKSSDPSVLISFNPGVVNGVGAGQTATFDITFTGDGRPHRFDLQFVREGTDVVLGSIPVVLGTPIPGDGYEFEDLEDGEIDDTVDFGNQWNPATPPNVAPSFTAGSDVTVDQNSGDAVIAGWATNILAGPPSEATQLVRFLVENDNTALFAIQPAISPDGTLAFRPAGDATGAATVTVRLRDSGGTLNGGVDTSPPQTFTITVRAAGALVVNSTFEFETRQALVIDFDQDVAAGLDVTDLQVTEVGTGAPVALQQFQYDAVLRRATVRFNPLVLADGNYRLTIAAGAVANLASPHLFGFFAFAGDANRDRAVNLADFSVLASRFNLPGTFSQGDFDYSGTTGLADFAILAAKFNTTLPSPAKGGLATTDPAAGLTRRNIAMPPNSSVPAVPRFSSSLVEEVLPSV